jgi:putative ABC transport system permease protein
VGGTIRINQEPWQVIGVMPKGFGFPNAREAVWTPIAFNEEDRGRGSHSFLVVARLKPGVTFDQSLTEMRAIGDRLSATYLENARETATVIRLRDQWMTSTRSTLTALLIAVGLVVLIAAANVASLLVARGHSRRRELAARMALGGSRGRIVAQILTESVLLSVAGAILGLVLAGVGTRGVVAVLGPGLGGLPYRDLSTISIDLPVFAVTAAVGLLAGIVAGLAPALTVLPSEPGEVLRDSEGRGSTARHGRRLKNALVSIEVGLALVVLASAALLITSIRKVLGVEPGLDPRNVVALKMSLPQPDFYGPATRTSFCEQEATHVGSVPGVAATSAVSGLPLSGAGASRSFVIEGAPDPGTTPPWGQYGVICPGYFATMGIPLRGRDFTLDDRHKTDLVVIINEALKDKYYKNEDPIGRRFRLGRFDTPSPWVTIVGVAGNVRHSGLQSEVEPYLYAPYQQAAWPSMTVVARTTVANASIAKPIRQALAQFEPEAPVNEPRMMSQVVDDSLGHLRFPMILFSFFAALAVALAATGIFGIASQSVQQRRRELGIRRALGAGSRQLYGMVVGQTMRPVVVGLALGVAGAFAGTRVIRSLLYGVSPTNLPTFVIVAVLLCLVAVVACLAPARRAAHVDPATVLRED